MQKDKQETARCVCNYCISCEVRSGGEGLGYLVFFDGEPTSETYGQRVRWCPGCGEQLELSTLIKKKQPR